MRTQPGFSLVELVAVVALVGLVAALAVPRVSRLENNVRASEVAALGAVLRDAASAAHAQYIAAGGHSAAAMVQGRSVHLLNGYPDAGPNGIRLAAADRSDFIATSTADSVVFVKSSAPERAACSVTYRVSESDSVPAMVTNLQTSGC